LCNLQKRGLPCSLRSTLDFSARRPGQHYHPRIVECRRCGQIYSNPFFPDQLIADLYRRAKYIDEPQLENMRADYVREFESALVDQPIHDTRILEVGCANGFFLHALYQKGYRNLRGVDPGQEAVSLAPAEIRHLIQSGFFGENSFPVESFDVVCCFQVMDHMPDPAAFLRAVNKVLNRGGIFLTINHDIRAPITRLLGERSPMYDIEHIYLFDRSTIQILFANCGFDVVDCRSLLNSYTLGYALKMFPLPSAVKRAIAPLFKVRGLASMKLRVPGGNMVTVGRKNDSSAASV
jgi:SAM-dependent methyltransferase